MRTITIISVCTLLAVGVYRTTKIAAARIFPPAQKTYPPSEILPLKPDYFYQNNNYTNGIEALLDGDLNRNFIPGYQMLNDGPHTIVCLFPQEWNTVVKKIRVFDGGEGVPITKPTRYFLVRRDNGQEVEIGNFKGELYRQWQEMDVPANFIAEKLIISGYQDNGAGSLGAGEFYGTELQIIGSHDNTRERIYSKSSPPLKNMLGSNGFWWDLTQDPKDGTRPFSVYEPKMKRWKETGIDMFRFYMDWPNFEPAEKQYAFQPTRIGWYTDELFDICKRNNIKPLMCIQLSPWYMAKTYSDSNAATDYTPVRAAFKDRREEPGSYTDAARLAFVVAARYGKNKNIDLSLLGEAFDHKIWYIAKNQIRTGLGTLEYFEFGNELDKDWKGRYNYMDGYKIAAFLSAIYDGHHHTIDIGFGKGKGAGLKTADSSMKLVVTGLAHAAPDTYRAIWDWSRSHRGLKKDGSVDLPFDVINYHQYSTNGGTLSQRAPITTGMPPELSGVLNTASDFARFSQTLGQGKEVWISEWGYDHHPESTYGVPQFSNYSTEEVIGAWSLRTMLLYPTRGIDRLIWFKTFDDDSLNPQFFSTMSLLHFNDPVYTRRAVADYMGQFSEFGNYSFDSVISERKPYVVRYKSVNGNQLYAVWSVEQTAPAMETRFADQQFKKVNVLSFTEQKGDYQMQVPRGYSAVVNHFVTGATQLKKDLPVKSSQLKISYGSVPVLIELKKD